MRLRIFSLFRFLPLFLLVALIAVGTAAAQDMVVEKHVEQESISFGSLLGVRITVHNPGNSAIEVVVQEVVVDAEPVSPAKLIVPEAPVGFIGMRLPYYEWKLSIAPADSEEILYLIRPLTPGEYIIAPTRVYVGGRQFISVAATVTIACNANSKCESAFSENFLNCPADCSSGSADSVCNPVDDNVCDPDCADGADSDCFVPEPLATAYTVSTESVKKTAVPFAWPHLVLFLIVLVPVSGLFIAGIGRNFRK